MAKKKTIKKENTETLTSVKVVDQPITYQGNVKLMLKRGDQVMKTYNFHNSATLRLLEGIADFLAGSFISGVTSGTQSNYIPNYLGIGYEAVQSTTDPIFYALTNELNIGSRVKTTINPTRINIEASTIILPITATIPGTTTGSARISELGLFSSVEPFSQTMLARVLIPEHIDEDTGETITYITIPLGWNLYIEWDILLQNNIVLQGTN